MTTKAVRISSAWHALRVIDTRTQASGLLDEIIEFGERAGIALLIWRQRRLSRA